MNSSPSDTIYTVGHSNHEIAEFIKLLKLHNITAIADVRSAPYSQYTPQFNRENIDLELKAASIAYVFLGEELGARPSNENYYKNGKADFARMAEGQEFKNGIKRLIEGSAKYRIAMMCAEKEPLDCHRTILVCRHLKSSIPNIHHILADGSVKTQDEIEAQLVEITKIKPDFLDNEPMIDRAYKARQNEIAYQT